MNGGQLKSTQIELEASEWLLAMNERLISIDHRARFEAWLKADPEHAEAYQRQKGIFQLAGSFPDLLEEARAEEAAAIETQRKRRKFAALAASVLLAVGAGFFAAKYFNGLGAGEEFQTLTAQVKDIRLEDGTLVTLGAASHIAVEFAEHERRVTLTRGEAFFEVTRDTRRPFLVTAGDTLVRVLGTKFDVHYGQEAVRVTVAEGRVAVMRTGEFSESKDIAPESQPNETKVLSAGEAAVANKAGEIAMQSLSNQEDLGAWRSGRLVYIDTPLKEIVSDINRYYEGRIELADEALGAQQLTLTFRAGEVDRALELIEAVVPVRVIRRAPNEVLLTRR